MFSETLSSRRRQLGFSTAQASRVLRLKEDVLIAFEEGDFEAMPKSGYAQGMLSSYARYLGLDAAQIVEMYTDELEHWRRQGGGRGTSRGGSGSLSAGVGQPYVASRGLLPTSGGPAGDMGSFATTRVRTRRTDPMDSDIGETSGYHDRSYADNGYGAYGSSQTRPYTGRAPERRVRRGGSRGYNDIQTRNIGPRDYEDDLRLGRDAESYRAASTRRGRQSQRGGSRTERPRIRRTPDGRGGSSRSRNRRSSRTSRQNTGVFQTPTQALVIVVAAIAVIAVILVVTISSCVSKNFGTATRTVPVSTATANDTHAKSEQSSDAASSQTAAEDDLVATGSSSGSSSTSKSRSRESSVSISVTDGAVTWLEVECDGTSEVAETVTGPWQHTYAVKESLTVQAGDTASVEVTQDGKQLQFDSMASGIGTIRIEVSDPLSSRSSKSSSDSTDAESGSGEAASERTSSAQSSSGTSSARMGNDAQDEDDEDASTSNDSTEYGDDTYDDTDY